MEEGEQPKEPRHDEPSQSPHDALFRRVFSEPEQAVAELRQVLPTDLVHALDWPTLRILPGTWIDNDLRRVQADLLCSVRLAGRPSLLYILLEHKSQPDRFTVFQLLVYCVRIWQSFRRQHKNARELPLIVPVVLHHGDGGWSSPRSMRRLVRIPRELESACRRYVPHFSFELDDFGVESDEALSARPMPAFSRLALLCLKGVRGSSDLETDLRRWASAMRALMDTQHGGDALSAVVSYFMAVGDLAAENIRRVLAEEVGPDAERVVMTTLDQIRRKALAEGREEGRVAILLRQLTLRFGDLPAEILDRVKQAESANLDVWAERVITAPSLEAVFASR